MNYIRQYNLLVEKSKVRNKPDVCERHHVVLKSLGGTNEPSNMVFLTPKKHYVAHHLLWKIHKNKEMHYAFWLMVNKTSKDSIRNYTITSRVYESAK